MYSISYACFFGYRNRESRTKIQEWSIVSGCGPSLDMFNLHLLFGDCAVHC